MLKLLRTVIVFAFFIARAATNAQSRRSSAPTLRSDPAGISLLVAEVHP